jgi:hypothetical protein
MRECRGQRPCRSTKPNDMALLCSRGLLLLHQVQEVEEELIIWLLGSSSYSVTCVHCFFLIIQTKEYVATDSFCYKRRWQI